MNSKDLDPFLAPFYRKGGTDCPFRDDDARAAVEAADLPEDEKARLLNETERAARYLNAPMGRLRAGIRDVGPTS